MRPRRAKPCSAAEPCSASRPRRAGARLRSTAPPSCLLLLLLAGCGKHELPVYNQVPDFRLTAQDGRELRGSQLDGQVWIADFIFTTCMGPCPRMTAQMHSLQRELPNVRLVSFTVDPANDTPPVLDAYARKFHADPQRWFFLTGSQPVLQQLSLNTFKLNDTGGALVHSTRFVLVDRQRRIRGYYGTEEADGIQRLLKDARALAQ